MACTRRRARSPRPAPARCCKGHEVLVLDLGGVLARRPVIFFRLAAGDIGCFLRVGRGRLLRCGGRFRCFGFRHRRGLRRVALRRDDDGGCRRLRRVHGGKAGVPHGGGEHEHQLHEPPRFPQPCRARRVLQREQQRGRLQRRNAPADQPAGEQDDAPDRAGTAEQYLPDAAPPNMHPNFPLKVANADFLSCFFSL